MDRYWFYYGISTKERDQYKSPKGDFVLYSDVEALQSRVRELEGVIKSAYIEGYLDTFEVVKEGTRKYAEEYWKHSESCKQLKGTHDER